MARGRMISKAISLDEKVDALSDDTARLLFTWMIPHLDCEGRLYGEARVFKSIVAPRRNYSIKKVEKVLTELEQTGLIERYSINGNLYISVPNFRKHQVGLRKDKESQSQIPPNTPDKRRTKDGVKPPQVKEKFKLKIKKEIYKERILPEWIDKETWDDFLEMRSKMKPPPTEKALDLIIKELEKLKTAGDDPNEVLKKSIMSGWRGVFPLKEGKSGANRGHNKTGRELPTTYKTPEEHRRAGGY